MQNAEQLALISPVILQVGGLYQRDLTCDSMYTFFCEKR